VIVERRSIKKWRKHDGTPLLNAWGLKAGKEETAAPTS
jgi:hypothetical protein